MLHVQHFVEQNIFDDKLRNGGMIHAAIEQNLVGAGIVAAELAAPTAIAPAEMRAGESTSKKFSVERCEQSAKGEMAALRVGGGQQPPGAAPARTPPPG